MATTHSTPIRPKNKGQKVIFKNPILERLTRTHIAVPISIFSVFSAGLIYYAFTYAQLPAYLIGTLFLSGLLIFSFIEYLVHRYAFHMDTDTELKQKLQYNLHGVHHEYPKDKGRLAMPPVVSVLLAVGLLVAFNFVIGEYTYAFLPGFIMGYASYLFVHFIVHAYQPPKNLFKILWINHSIHHYKDNNKAFGVSSPLWDYVFRTLP
ncbi:sterol desaturase family protein [Rhodocytophaga aerolata]|uniref:Sterol desaturase family protein n=1 Tax=Rhodocytophaga aerolata TaxID=455078 RepID=A0ABT8RB46_9BACT|nr:sterol desaturase family protein [Rhodocytophaga aerolata]MDO1448524.1 sterol desaturase family protein [Rhodocytophaga aerolata]